jgi:hypothetical protein
LTSLPLTPLSCFLFSLLFPAGFSYFKFILLYICSSYVFQSGLLVPVRSSEVQGHSHIWEVFTAGFWLHR